MGGRLLVSGLVAAGCFLLSDSFRVSDSLHKILRHEACTQQDRMLCR
jgi:hypothetical protein